MKIAECDFLFAVFTLLFLAGAMTLQNREVNRTVPIVIATFFTSAIITFFSKRKSKVI